MNPDEKRVLQKVQLLGKMEWKQIVLFYRQTISTKLVSKAWGSVFR